VPEGTSDQALWGTAGGSRQASRGAPSLSGEHGITQPSWSGVIVVGRIDPVNADLVSRMISAGRGGRPCQAAPARLSGPL
jgi:hypothetical protein